MDQFSSYGHRKPGRPSSQTAPPSLAPPCPRTHRMEPFATSPDRAASESSRSTPISQRAKVRLPDLQKKRWCQNECSGPDPQSRIPRADPIAPSQDRVGHLENARGGKGNEKGGRRVMERKRGFGLGGKGGEGMRSKATGSQTMVAGTAGPARQTAEPPGTREGREAPPLN